jgi:molybdopterin-guanine dinucleotide biosynthesis protein A
VTVAALLLTGGASRRMGRDKATLPAPGGVTLAGRTAGLLLAVADPVVELGPGFTDLPAVADPQPGAGPLAAVAAGAAHLALHGHHGPALVVATDLPLLHLPMLTWLVGHPAAGPVVPLVEGRPQWLCARYDGATLAGAARAVARGRRRMADLVEGRDLHLANVGEWGPVAAPAAWWDVDTPEDLDAVTAADRP